MADLERPPHDAAAPPQTDERTGAREPAEALEHRAAQGRDEASGPAGAGAPACAAPEPGEAPATAPAREPREFEPVADDIDTWGNPSGVIPRSRIDPDAVKIVRRLRRHGFTAYLVGGGVRDLLLGRTPKDFDIATSAHPEEVRRLFRNCRIIGRRFRLAHVFFREKIIEVSTFRALVEPVADGGAGSDTTTTSDVAEQVDLLIRSDNVFGTAEEDAVRRDFTINGLFYDVERGEVIDYVGGQEDLERRVIRTIGDPDIRFREDPIRMLRAVKFAARLGFTLDPATEAALRRHRRDVRRSAPPRVLEEVFRLIGGGAAAASFTLLAETETLEVILPELQNLYRLAREGNAIARYLWGTLERHLEALDAYDRGRRSVSNAVLVGVLVLPLLLDRPDGMAVWAPSLGVRAAEGDGDDATGTARGNGRPDHGPKGRRGRRGGRSAHGAQRKGIAGEIDGLVAAVTLRLALARRDSATLRAALSVLWRMLAAPRTSRAAVLVRRPAFPEALLLLRLRNLACGGELAEEVAYWEGTAGGAAVRGAAPGGGAPAPRGRRHRSGRRAAPAAPRRGAGVDTAIPTLLVGGPAAARASAEAAPFGAGGPEDGRPGGPGRRRRRRRRGPRKPDRPHGPA